MEMRSEDDDEGSVKYKDAEGRGREERGGRGVMKGRSNGKSRRWKGRDERKGETCKTE